METVENRLDEHGRLASLIQMSIVSLGVDQIMGKADWLGGEKTSS
jgi:hypothetical protein